MITTPFSNNELKTKKDYQKLVNDLFEPILPYYNAQSALIDFGTGGAWFDMKASSLEGAVRPLWGIIPLVLGGGEFHHWPVIQKAIIEGTDPQHPNFWGHVGDIDQRSVEMAVIGFLLLTLPEFSYTLLTDQQKENLVNWLAPIQFKKMPPNNWLFFTILVQEGLKNIGRYDLVDDEIQNTYFERIESWYLGDGWYGDGDVNTVDHYGAYAIHYYSILYSTFVKQPNPRLTALFKARAKEFFEPFKYWFSDKGEVLPLGRSMVYRFATSAFWGALSLVEFNTSKVKEIRGLWERQIKVWADQPIFDAQGLLTRGYSYPNLMMCESYNSPTSPYWCMKAFLPLCLPDDAEFWQLEPLPLSVQEDIYSMPSSQSIAQRVNGESIVHFSGPINILFQKDKYNKFAYTTWTGVDTHSLLYADTLSFGDNILAFSFDSGVNWQMRHTNIKTTVDNNIMTTVWSTGVVEVETEITVCDNGKSIRKHTFELLNDAWVVETGYAVGHWYQEPTIVKESRTSPTIEVQAEEQQSVIKSLDKYEKEALSSIRIHTNIVHPRATVPFLLTKLKRGKHILISEFTASN
ncbi:DUF2264 domain-containing protein [Vibrio sp. SS-MA-C1-2]|uniref:DUF2264 domain-containing protein n=1 Tax=Vibrio sp. SS-MA-C1-2 TaxID=2908646 RepID=UPI001F2293BB|nr:DUF2264 domain-containing protein [Vibrio sp. SS-MA-C1-2]UJF17621.1 DUF2264 domain-containing protein [Vibrio sp. SS-MA-C1-2]